MNNRLSLQTIISADDYRSFAGLLILRPNTVLVGISRSFALWSSCVAVHYSEKYIMLMT